jgi:hypothetical protein
LSGFFVTAQQRSIVLQAAQRTAARLLDMELRLCGTANQLWPMPEDEAARLAAVEARYGILTQRLYDAALAFYAEQATPKAAAGSNPLPPAGDKPAPPSNPPAPSKGLRL